MTKMVNAGKEYLLLKTLVLGEPTEDLKAFQNIMMANNELFKSNYFDFMMKQILDFKFQIWFFKVKPELLRGHEYLGSNAIIYVIDSKYEINFPEIVKSIFEVLKFIRTVAYKPVISIIILNTKSKNNQDLNTTIEDKIVDKFCKHVKIFFKYITELNIEEFNNILSELRQKFLEFNELSGNWKFWIKESNNLISLLKDEEIFLKVTDKDKMSDLYQLQGMKIKKLDLSRININGIQSDDFSLNFLQNNIYVEVLDLSGLRLSNLDLQPLQSCPNLKELILCSNELKTLNLDPLLGLKFLETIDLNFNNFSEKTFKIPTNLKEKVKISYIEDFKNHSGLDGHCTCRWCN